MQRGGGVTGLGKITKIDLFFTPSLPKIVLLLLKLPKQVVEHIQRRKFQTPAELRTDHCTEESWEEDPLNLKIPVNTGMGSNQ